MITVLRNTSPRLEQTWYVDGTATDPDDQTATIHITKADGSDLVPAATAATRLGVGHFGYTLPALSSLNILTVTWTATFDSVPQSAVETVELVGDVFVTLHDLRQVPGLGDAAKVSNQELEETRREFEDLAERYCGVAMVPRFARETLTGRGNTNLLLGFPRPRSVLSASSTDTAGTATAFTTTNWRLNNAGTLTTDGDTLTASNYGEQNLTIEYEHGLDNPPPGIVRACKLYCQWQLLRDRSQVSRDIRQSSDPSGFSTTYSMVDWDAGRPTGVGEIDGALNAFGRRAPAVA